MIICSGKIQGKTKLEKAHRSDAGYDIFAIKDVVVPAKGRAVVETGLHIELPFGFFGLVYSRSGLSFKHGLEVGAGVIDSNYRGEVKIILYNHSDENYHVSKGEKVAQLLVLPIASVEWQRVEKLSESERGENGFGSTDKPNFII